VELKNTVHRAFILSENDIGLSALPMGVEEIPDSNSALNLKVGTTLAEAERRLILATLEHCAGDKKAAGNLLGISLKTIYNRLNAYKSRRLASWGASRAFPFFTFPRVPEELQKIDLFKQSAPRGLRTGLFRRRSTRHRTQVEALRRLRRLSDSLSIAATEHRWRAAIAAGRHRNDRRGGVTMQSQIGFAALLAALAALAAAAGMTLASATASILALDQWLWSVVLPAACVLFGRSDDPCTSRSGLRRPLPPVP
jgi:hypothetical protein